MNYNQFCPIAKAAEILGERWNILILREILMGGRRFNVLQRGLGDISPALLTKRLKQLEDQNMIIRRRIPGQKGYEYFPTEACESLLPVLFALGEWGIIWSKNTILDQDFDVEFLMLYLERSIDREKIKIALGMKQMLPNPWDNDEEKYQFGNHSGSQIFFHIAVGF